MRTSGALLLVLLAACAPQPQPEPQAPAEGLSTQPAGVTRLVIEQTTDRTQTWTLRCDPPGGDHPDPAAACGALAAAGDPFAPLSEEICTEQYGGDQTARISGSYRGAPVEISLSRVDGCRIRQWDRLGAVLPGPVGVEPPT